MGTACVPLGISRGGLEAGVRIIWSFIHLHFRCQDQVASNSWGWNAWSLRGRCTSYLLPQGYPEFGDRGGGGWGEGEESREKLCHFWLLSFCNHAVSHMPRWISQKDQFTFKSWGKQASHLHGRGARVWKGKCEWKYPGDHFWEIQSATDSLLDLGRCENRKLLKERIRCEDWNLSH